MNEKTEAKPGPLQRVSVTRADLPVHCPGGDMTLWNTHPRVYLPLDEEGEATCPYCGTVYVLAG
ncbi:MAG: zinc-finger domain-containing protein [Gammaproteobacteria bacterium]|jgi:uncharacterized Zn-finger protein|nr:zinc-finger domain-containing protein [Gammaproteobacteria bacterium]